MKKTALIVLLLVTGFIVKAQNPVNAFFVKYADRQGLNFNTTKSGDTSSYYYVEGDHLEGPVIIFGKNGLRESCSEFENGQFHGWDLQYDNAGRIFRKSFYRHDTLVYVTEYKYYKSSSVVKWYHTLYLEELIPFPFPDLSKTKNSKVVLDIVGFLSHHTIVGVEYNFYPDGNLESKCEIENDKFNGKAVYYYESGKERQSVNYENNMLEGICITYFESGQIAYTENYQKGKLEGECIYYWENGNIYSKKYYTSGKKNGTFVYYEEDGTVSYSETFKMGDRVN